MQNKSVLSFYSLPPCKSANDATLSYAEIWESYILKKLDGVSCGNVFGFETSAQDLKTLLDSPKSVDAALVKDIQNEFENGAAYMFVSPEIGEPISGYAVATFLNDTR